MTIFVLIQSDHKGQQDISFHEKYEDALHSAEVFPWGNSYRIEKHQLGSHTLIETINMDGHKSGPSRPAKVGRPHTYGLWIDEEK